MKNTFRIFLFLFSITTLAQKVTPNYFENNNATLILTPSGLFQYRWAMGIAGRGYNTAVFGKWKMKNQNTIAVNYIDRPPISIFAQKNDSLQKGEILVTNAYVGKHFNRQYSVKKANPDDFYSTYTSIYNSDNATEYSLDVLKIDHSIQKIYFKIPYLIDTKKQLINFYIYEIPLSNYNSFLIVSNLQFDENENLTFYPPTFNFSDFTQNKTLSKDEIMQMDKNIESFLYPKSIAMKGKFINSENTDVTDLRENKLDTISNYQISKTPYIDRDTIYTYNKFEATVIDSVSKPYPSKSISIKEKDKKVVYNALKEIANSYGFMQLLEHEKLSSLENGKLYFRENTSPYTTICTEFEGLNVVKITILIKDRINNLDYIIAQIEDQLKTLLNE
jgi:hypothetical protein